MSASGASKKASYHHGDLRGALIAAAESLMREQEGWTFTLREVARAAGVSHNAPYNHFSDRRALLAAVAARGFDDFRDSMEAAIAAVAESDAVARLAASARGYVGFAVGSPPRFRLMFSAELAGYEDAVLDAARACSFGVLSRLIDEGVAAGVFRADPHGVHALAAWSLVHGLSNLVLDRMVACPHDEEGLTALTDAVGARLLDGLIAKEPLDRERAHPAPDRRFDPLFRSPTERQPR